MKIHYLVTSLENGGAEFAIPSIVQSLERHGCTVEVIACEPRDMKAAPKLDAAHIPYTVMFDRRHNFIDYTKAYLKIIKKSRPDIIWTSLSGATIVGQFAGVMANIPVVSWKHSAAVRIYTQIFRKLSKLWIADSAVVEEFLNKRMKIPRSNILSWPLYFCSDILPVRSYWDGTRPLHLGSMGRLKEQKNYSVLIDAIYKFLQKNPDFKRRLKVSISGTGPLQPMLQEKINRLSLQDNFTLMGYVEDTEAYLSSLDVYIQPSTFEGMCLAAHEAMAAGLPVIASPVGELAYSVINGQTGFLLSGNIEEGIVESLESIFQKPYLVKQYGQNAQKFVAEKFSLKKFDAASLRIVTKIKKEILKI
ncbi:hypothetical protein B0W47_08545 [Komagataeibacter nataicola]|uniref:Glycosyltransferase n=2 Tax=Komagataeibacter nataicola TaxID=265960 RepID=A0A9N7CLD3_9PROT|nr:glycosyltransferase [Komagataeibacter nataicola]AQU87518.1 hypothetical protein B0W47_08545 [Komagataeibacter nataicola]PYD65430.1 glycosyltransferase [Komagataeibacter nataicola]WEQ55262.1 glycosyltransferase [Komagataeibacter nataicola]